MGVKGVFVGFGTGVVAFDCGALGIALSALLGVGAGAGVGVAFGTGVDGGLTSGSGFGFILVIKNDSFAPVPLGSHSMKLYEGK
jgi:hypothetical protein